MGKRILVVDDSVMMRKMVKSALESEDHEVVGEAKNGADAVELYKTLKPDLVTMDITMREMDGFAAAREILNHDPGAKIIFLSNLDEGRYRDSAMDIGALGYVSKSDHMQILELIQGLCREQR